MPKADREDLGRFYRPRFEFFRKNFPSFDPLALETHLSLVRTGDLLRATADRRMRRHGLTGASFGILCLLQSSPEKRLNMHDIGKQLVVTQANVTGLVDTLERHGFVRRLSDSKDRRIRLIELTVKGGKALDGIRPDHSKYMRTLYGALTRREKETIIRVLRAVRRTLTRFWLVPFLLLAALPVRAEQASTGSYTLSDCFRLALDRSENLQIQAERIIQTEELYRQAFGAILPTINFVGTETLQDTSGVESGGGSVGGTLTRADRPQAQITVSQPIFSGLREFSGSKAVKEQGRSQELLLERAKKLLFQDVAAAFYLVLQNETDLDDVRSILGLTQDRIKELKERIRLGKSRPTEMLSTESQLATLKAQEEQVRVNLALARENLSFLTGVDLSSASFVDEIGEVAQPAPLETFLARMPNRTDVRAAMRTLESDKYQVRAAQGALFPTLSAAGNYYLKRVGFQEPIDWDVVFTVDQPLFHGGAIWSDIRRTQSVWREARKDLELTERQADSEIRRNYLTLQSAAIQTHNLEDAYRKADASYRDIIREYRLGLVNNLEVLQAISQVQDAKRSWDQSAVAVKLGLIRLKVSTEELP